MRKATPVNSYFTTTDVARAWDCSSELVRKLARAGRLPTAATTPRGTRLFDPRDVERVRREREASAEE